MKILTFFKFPFQSNNNGITNKKFKNESDVWKKIKLKKCLISRYTMLIPDVFSEMYCFFTNSEGKY